MIGFVLVDASFVYYIEDAYSLYKLYNDFLNDYNMGKVCELNILPDNWNIKAEYIKDNYEKIYKEAVMSKIKVFNINEFENRYGYKFGKPSN